MHGFIAWLADSRASAAIQDATWAIPALQTIHILAVSVLMAAVALLNLRLLGVICGGEAMDRFTHRYVPWVLGALVVLLLTGSVLIVGEPNRDLANRTFWTKMSLLLTVVVITVAAEAPVWRKADFWNAAPLRPVARSMAVVSLACWVGIVLCGRWIAYTYTN